MYLYCVKNTQNISVTVDAIVFGFQRDSGVSVLLIKRKYAPFKGKWAIPGGFVDPKESLDAAVERELLEETGMKIDYIEQLHTFGKPNRDPRSHTISIAYLALVNSSKMENIKAGDDAAEAEWFNIKHLPLLAFDHRQILNMAIERLQFQMVHYPIAFELLDRKFAFSDLENLYSTLLDKPVDRRNFKKKIIKLGVLDELDEKVKSSGVGRPGNYYEFNKNAFIRLEREGLSFNM
ncbi:MAG: 8-oxo-dGTP diphosphatase [Salibacteraceae bacterium]